MIKKVFHVFDQADVGKHLVRMGRQEGKHWLRFPGLSGPLAKFKLIDYGWNRLLFRVMSGLPSCSELTLHIHGAHLSRWFSSSKNCIVLHVHGSEVRSFDRQGNVVLEIDQETMDGITNANRVVYSTPDLGGLVKGIRKDAIWIPNPISPEAFRVSPTKSLPGDYAIDVFFPHAWSHAKGIDYVIALVEKLKSKPGGDKLVFAGVALGPNQSLALEHGFELYPPCTRSDLLRIMSKSRLVLGQGFGIVAMTDLEAMASGSNYLMFPLEPQTREAYGLTIDDQPTASIKKLEEIAESYLLGNSGFTTGPAFGKILRRHTPESIWRELNSVYS